MSFRYAPWARVGLITVATLVLLIALFERSQQCGDTCDPPGSGGHWWHVADSWQWAAQLDVAVLGFALALAFGFVRGRRGQLVGAAAAACVVIWFSGVFVASFVTYHLSGGR